MAALLSSQCSGSSAGASAAGRDCQPYSSNVYKFSHNYFNFGKIHTLQIITWFVTRMY